MSSSSQQRFRIPLLRRNVRMQSRFMIYFGAVVVAMMLLVILVMLLFLTIYNH